MLFVGLASYGQDTILLSYHKTVNLIFYADVIDDDCSTDDIFMERKNNILKLGVSLPFENDKSINVYTADGMLYTFVTRYDENLTTLNYLIPQTQGIPIPNFESKPENIIESADGVKVDADSLDVICRNVLRQKRLFDDIGAPYKKITVELAGIWISGEYLYFKLLMSNESNIPYDIVSTNLYIQEKGFARKASTQPIEKKPFYVYTDSKRIPPGSIQKAYIMVFDKFTISKNKKLMFEMIEKDGGRRLEFEVNKDFIIQAPKLK